jgi:hydroxymethylglutaryl-CoA lyase
VRAGVDEVNAVVITTDTFNRRNQGEPTADTLRRLADLVPAARAAGLRVTVTVGASFGCPYEGEVPVTRLGEVVAEVAGTRPDEIALADTIGVAVPADVTRRFAAARGAAGPGPRWRAHFHNTRNTGYANALAALSEGVTSLDASLGGIGGCPFAPAATGNVATEDLAYLMARSGVLTGLDLADLCAAASWLEARLGHAVPGMLSKAGPFPQAGGNSGPAGAGS